MKKPIKIVQLADYQIEARNHGQGNRYDEMKSSLTEIVRLIKIEKPDVIIHTGDLVEFAQTTSTERELLRQFLKESATICLNISTLGNHDIKMRNNELLMNAKNEVIKSDVEVLINGMDSPNMLIWVRTGFYEAKGMKFAVWGHPEKYDKVNPRPYSPWELDEAKGKNPDDYIELFHDPLLGCISFDGKEDKTFSNYKISLNDFKTPLVLAGDIHKGQIIRTENRTFTYCSSSIMRDFGEGNYYKNLKLDVNGNDAHGFNVVEYDGTKDSKIRFVKVRPTVTRHTILLDDEFDYERDIENLRIVESETNLIRFKVLSKVNEFLTCQDDIYSFLKSKYNCIFEQASYEKGIGFELDEDNKFESVEDLINTDKILEISKIYVDKVIDKTTMVKADDKEEAKKLLNDLFVKEFENREDTTNELKTVNVQRLKMSNALVFGDDVQVDFDNKGNIVRVLGSNAVGKTKFYQLLGYMFTDIVDSNMRVTQLKNNRLELFNYTRSGDVVYNEMDFAINGEQYKLSKTVTRKWKRGKNMCKDENWKSFIVGVPSLDIELTLPDGTVETDYSTIMAFMSDLMSSEDFYTHIFVNQFSLESLLKMRPEHLIAQILKIIGLNFFESLNEKYDGLKETILDGLRKPDGTVDSLLELIGEHTRNIGLNIVDVDKSNENLKTLEGEIELDKLSLKASEKSVANVTRVSDVQTKIDNSIVTIKEFNNAVEKVASDISKLEAADKNIDSEKTLSEITKKGVERVNKITSKANLTASLNNLSTEKSNIETKQANYLTKIENEKTDKISEINKTVVANSKIITTNNNRLNEIKNIVFTNLNAKKTAHNKLVDEARESHTDKNTLVMQASNKSTLASSQHIVAKSELTTLENSLKSLEGSLKCGKCNAFVDGNIDEKITKAKSDIAIQKSKIEKAKTDADATSKEYNKLSDEAKVLKSELDALLLIEIKHTINDEIDLKNEVLKISPISKKANDDNIVLLAEIKTIREDESHLQDNELQALLQDLLNLGTKSVTLNHDIAIDEEDIKTIDAEVVKLRASLELKNKIAIALVTKESNKVNIQKDIDLENERRLVYDSEMVLAKNSEDVFKAIDLIKTEIAKKGERRDIILSSITTIELKNEALNDKVEALRVDILDLKNYTLNVAVIKQYKTMLGNKGLQTYIFSKIVDILNTKLSNLLGDIPLRLFFDKELLELRKYDLVKNSISGVLLTSGMECSILGLSLLNALKSLNQVRTFNFLFIDEISGQLNKGEGLSYKAANYQKIFVDLLARMKEDSCLYVVDHVIDDIGESKTLEVIPTEEGSKIVVKH